MSGIDEDSPRGQGIVQRRKAIFRERYFPACRPFPQARELVARLKEDGLTIAIATSSSGDELSALLHAARVHDLIEVATTASDAERSKPDPDVVLVAAGKTGLAHEELIMVGDTPYDVEAAARADIRAVAFRCGGWSDAELAGAVAIYDDAADLLARYDESPFGGARLDASARMLRSASRRQGT